jgi:hypothetical protein
MPTLAEIGTGVGGFAKRARDAISPWNMFSATDVASFLPGGGMVQASQEQFPAALKAYRAGDYGTAAREGVAGTLGTLGDVAWAAGPVIGATAGTALKAAGRAAGPEKVGSTLADLGKPGIKAYHGSPHSFDRFDMSKIGTGEGAQAYGHGLYFAEKEGVARSYRDALSNYTVNGKPVDYNDGSDLASSWFTAFNDRKKAADYLQGQIDNPPKSLQNFRSPEEIDTMKKAVSLLQSDAPIQMTKPSGSMYEVRINADPADMLDWDKPLMNQPETIRRKLGWTPEAENAYKSAQQNDTDALLAALEGNPNSYKETKMPIPAGLPPLSATGADIVKGGSIFDRASDAVKSRALLEKGIPGIKYLDGGSRTAGEGSRNYVVFDDKLVEILRKYGWVPGAAIPTAAMYEYQKMQQQPAQQQARPQT